MGDSVLPRVGPWIAGRIPGCPREQPGILVIALLLPGGLHRLDDLAEFFLHLVGVESRSLKGGF